MTSSSDIDAEKKSADELHVGVSQLESEDADIQDVVKASESGYDEAEMKRLLWKIDMILLPLMWICGGVQQADKTSISTQATFGLRQDTGLVGQQYSWLSTIFYISYLVCEFPGNMVLQRFNVGKALAGFMLVWGIIVLCVAFAQNFTHLMILRTLQGAAECTISPGLLIITGSWYTTREHPLRSLIWGTANAGFNIIASLIMYGIGTYAQKHPGGLVAWKGISFFLGATTIVLSVVVYFFLGTPREVRWLTEREKAMAIARTVENRTGSDRVKNEKFKWDQVKSAFKDPQTYFFFFVTVCVQIPNGGVTTFGSLVYTSFGFTALETLVKGVIPQAILSIAHFILVGWICLKRPQWRLILTLLSLIPAFVGFLCLGLIQTTPANLWIKWGLFFMSVTGNIVGLMIWTLLPSNVAGRTKKSVTATVVFVAYCTGNSIGAQIFQAKDAPKYIPALIACSVLYATEFFALLAWRQYYIWTNARRDQAARVLNLSEEDIRVQGKLNAENDMDDYENQHFRYSI